MTRIDELPSARDRWEDITSRLEGRTPAVFLDFDGTLSPIVEDPTTAYLPEATRDALLRLRAQCWIALMSGRDADDVRTRVGIDDLVYAGSHGFDVIWPDGRREQRGTEHRATLHEAEQLLREALGEVPGVELEPKGFAVAVHYRRVAKDRVPEVEDAVTRVASSFDGLRRTGGKKVFELRPDMDWDKGRALLWLLAELGLDGDEVLPLYLGDDLTDEDGFAALAEHGGGLGLLVRGEDDGRDTLADYAMADVDEAGEVIDRLAALLERRA